MLCHALHTGKWKGAKCIMRCGQLPVSRSVSHILWCFNYTIYFWITSSKYLLHFTIYFFCLLAEYIFILWSKGRETGLIHASRVPLLATAPWTICFCCMHFNHKATSAPTEQPPVADTDHNSLVYVSIRWRAQTTSTWDGQFAWRCSFELVSALIITSFFELFFLNVKLPNKHHPLWLKSYVKG